MVETKLYLGDCLDIMPQLPSESIDLCVTSPPYNLDIKYDGYCDSKDYKYYYKWSEKWLTEVFRLLKNGGRLCLNHYLATNIDSWQTPIMELKNIALNIGYNFHGIAIWDDITLNKLTAWGSWMSASAPFIKCPYEAILFLNKGQWNIGKGKSDISKEEFIDACSGIWKMGTEKQKDHPAAFPLSLPRRCIQLLSFVGATVLDPFMGSGTTGVACVLTDRNFIGIEISKNYFDLAQRRIEDEKRQMKLLFYEEKK